MSEDGSLHQISVAIGELRGEVRGIKELMTEHKDLTIEHQKIADEAWDRLDAELRNVKHDYRNVDSKVEGISRHQALGAQQIASIENEISGPEGIKQRLSALERAAKNAAAIFTLLYAAMTIAAFVLAHYGVEMFKWIFNRPLHG
jgi:chromosome segregation ATPase